MFYWRNNKHLILIPGIVVWILTILMGCNPNQQKENFYPIDSLITSQIISLSKEKAVLHKEAFFGGKSDTLTYIPGDTSAWVNELDIFRQLKIMNKPVNRGSYIVDDNLYDPGSNLTVKVFTSKKEELPVSSLRIFYDDALLRPRKIEAVYHEENPLYQSSKELCLEFQQINNKTLLTSYSITGGQKMILKDSVQFAIKGKIQIK
jgi:hypothetical protein